MKYFKNTKTFALAFRKGEGINGELVDFDCLRVFTDTGNIATTGITQVSDEDFEELSKNKTFLQAIKDKELVEVSEEEVKNPEDKLKAKEAEIKDLKAKLKKAEGGKAVEELERVKAESDAKDEEIKSLKAQLEGLSAGAEKADDSEEDF